MPGRYWFTSNKANCNSLLIFKYIDKQKEVRQDDKIKKNERQGKGKKVTIKQMRNTGK